MFLVLLSYLAFFSIALPDSMLGVAWPAMRISFQQPISAAGLVPPLGVAATLVSTTSSACLLYRIGLGRLLATIRGMSYSACRAEACRHRRPPRLRPGQQQAWPDRGKSEKPL